MDGYISEGFGDWELIGKVEGKFNRYVTYPGNVFHSVEVVVDPDPDDLARGRLTQRVFVDQVASAAR